MSRPKIEEVQLRSILLFLFDKGLKPKEATENVNEIYGEILNIRKCQRWFKQFKNGDRNLKFSLHAASHCFVAKCVVVYSPERIVFLIIPPLIFPIVHSRSLL